MTHFLHRGVDGVELIFCDQDSNYARAVLCPKHAGQGGDLNVRIRGEIWQSGDKSCHVRIKINIKSLRYMQVE